VRALSPTAATAIISVAVAAGIVGYLAVPAFTSRASSRTVLLASSALLVLAVPLLVAAPLVPLQILAALTFGFAGATFYSVLQATYLGLRPGQAGTSQAVVSTIGLLGIGFPALVGMMADAFGLAAGLALYAAVPLAILLLVVGTRTDR
jgi:hypothetical protein